MKKSKPITVYEHESLKADGIRLQPEQLKALQTFYGEKGIPYYTLIHNGVKFNEYVGVIQVGDTLIEILPKADKYKKEDDWRSMLIGMLRTVGLFEIHSPTSSSLKVKSNSILDLYFELFLNEVEYLIHRGLCKKYRQTEGNIKALKGTILFAQHIQKNLIHKERFYVRHHTYDLDHSLNQILHKAISLIKQVNINPLLNSKAASLEMVFMEIGNIKITEATFEKLVFNRKTEGYRKAIEIARLLLLNFHPDVSRGKNNVLALMFDMNLLWERFIYVSLKQELQRTHSSIRITPQASKYFWKPENGYRNTVRPDIVINKDKLDCVVIDTKWKNLQYAKPSSEDLKQMFVYHEYFRAVKVAMAYPGDFEHITGNFFTANGQEGERSCSLIALRTKNDIKQWQREIGITIKDWMLKSV